MGVDYDAVFGIGVVLAPLEEQVNGNDYDDLEDWIQNLPGTEGELIFEYRYWGDECYSGDPDTYALTIPDPFSDGLEGFIIKYKKFQDYLEKNKQIKYEDTIDLVGGLNVW